MSRRRAKVRFGSVAAMFLLTCGAVVAALAVPETSRPQFDGGNGGQPNMGLYTHSTGGCTTSDRVDPVGTVFYGGAYDWYTGNSIVAHAGWGDTVLDAGGNQTFAVSGYCVTQTGSYADNNVWNDRNHIRTYWNYNLSYDPSYSWWSPGSPHFEVIVTCGGQTRHAIRQTINGSSGFDLARARLANLMPHTPNYAVGYGNTQTMWQCTGWGAASQGWIRFIYQHASPH